MHFHKVISDLFSCPGILPVDTSSDKKIMELVRNNKESFRSNCQPRKLKVGSYARAVEEKHKGYPLMYMAVTLAGKVTHPQVPS